jgi:hypothetical protein
MERMRERNLVLRQAQDEAARSSIFLILSLSKDEENRAVSAFSMMRKGPGHA